MRKSSILRGQWSGQWIALFPCGRPPPEEVFVLRDRQCRAPLFAWLTPAEFDDLANPARDTRLGEWLNCFWEEIFAAVLAGDRSAAGEDDTSLHCRSDGFAAPAEERGIIVQL